MATARKSKKAGVDKALNFEEAIAKLEGIVQKLEEAEVPLEEALGMFEEGVRLSKICQGKLAEAEKKVQVLLKDDEGGLELQPLDEEDDPDAEGESGVGRLF